VQGLPTIRFIKAGNHLEYSGDRSVESLVQFVTRAQAMDFSKQAGGKEAAEEKEAGNTAGAEAAEAGVEAVEAVAVGAAGAVGVKEVGESKGEAVPKAAVLEGGSPAGSKIAQSKLANAAAA